MKIPGVEDGAVYSARVCGKCGDVKLRKFVKTEFLDGGFTRADEFERTDGWAWHNDTGWLCPKCEEEYQGLILRFMNKATNDGLVDIRTTQKPVSNVDTKENV